MMQILRRSWLGNLLALVAGAVSVFGFAPWSLWPVPILMLAVLLYLGALVSTRSAFWRGYWFGFGLFLAGVSWVQVSINLFGGVPTWLANMIMLVFVAILALFPALAMWAARKFANPGCGYAVSGAAFLLLFEWLRGWVFTGFPWLSLGYSQIQGPLAGLAPIGGVYLVSFVAAMLAAFLYLLIIARGSDRVWAVLGIALFLALGQWLRGAEWTTPTGRVLDVAVVQPNIPQAIKWLPGQLQPTLRLFADSTREAQDADLVVWPETAIPSLYHRVKESFSDPLAKSLNEAGGTLVFGVPQMSNGYPRNVLISISPQHGEQIYVKRHLVPFGEYLPFDQYLRPILDWISIPMSNFVPGDGQSSLLPVADDVYAAASICYEDAFGREALAALPKAGVLLNVSNDAWFGDSLAPQQHLQIAQFRSLETGRPMIRATNSGISAFIDHKGRAVSQVPLFERAVKRQQVKVYAGSTPYMHSGDLPAILAATFLVVSGGVSRLRKKLGVTDT